DDEEGEAGPWSFGNRSARAEPAPPNDHNPESVTRGVGSQVRILRILVVVRFGLGCGFLFFHRLLDDLLLDEGLRRDRLANHAARNRVSGGNSAWGDGRDCRRGLRHSGSIGGRGPAGRLASRGWDLDDGRSASTAARRGLGFARERSALVADGGRRRGEGSAGRAWRA